MGCHLGSYILTHSDVWGFVFRIDIQSKYQIQSSKPTHRFICWSAEEDDTVAGTALGSELINFFTLTIRPDSFLEGDWDGAEEPVLAER